MDPERKVEILDHLLEKAIGEVSRGDSEEEAKLKNDAVDLLDELLDEAQKRAKFVANLFSS